MTASAATAALAATPSVESFGLPATDTHLIAKLRRLDPELLTTITAKEAK